MANPPIYKPELMSDAQLMSLVMCRGKILSSILEVVSRNLNATSNIHVLITGLRGMGKSLLVHRIKAQVRTHSGLSKELFPIPLSQEGENIASASDLWTEALAVAGQGRPIRAPSQDTDQKSRLKSARQLHERMGNELIRFAQRKGVRLLLIVENFDRLIRQMKSANVRMIIEFVNEHPEVMLLATAIRPLSTMTVWRRHYLGGFVEYPLHPLRDKEFTRLWNSFSQNPIPSQYVRPLQILTGGNPRLIAILSQVPLQDFTWMAIRPRLEEIVDLHAEYFNHHLASLRLVPHRKVYEAIATCWDPAPIETIVSATGLLKAQVATALDDLLKRGLVIIHHDDSDVARYELHEHFYGIYLLMTRGGAESVRARAAMHFMFSFYTHSENMKNALEILKKAVGEPQQPRDLAINACAAIVERLNKYTVKEALRIMTEPVQNEIAEAKNLLDLIGSAPEAFATLARFNGGVAQGYQMLSGPTAPVLLGPLETSLRIALGQKVCAARAVLEMARDIARLMEPESGSGE